MSSVIEKAAPMREVVTCSLCGHVESTVLFQIQGFPIRQCAQCHMRYVSPRLTEEALLQMYAQEQYFKSDNSLVHGYTDYFSDKDNIVATFARRFRWTDRWIKPGSKKRLLDVGCAAGYAVEYALSRGWDAFGIEPSPHAAAEAKRRLGDRILCQTLKDLPYERQSFDLITIWDVIEHVPSPLRTLEQLAELLVPGGYLSIITPDCGSLVARLMRQHWMEYAKPTEHIHFYSSATMTQALAKTGFTVCGKITAGKYVGTDFIVNRLQAYWPSLGSRANEKKASSFRLYINPGDKLFFLAQKDQPTTRMAQTIDNKNATNNA